MFSGQTFIISSQGSKGDINPLLGLGKKIGALGGRVIFLANSFYENTIRSEGLEFSSTGSAHNQLEYSRNPDVWRAGSDVASIEWSLITKEAVKKSFAYVDKYVNLNSNLPIILGASPIANGAFWASDVHNLETVQFVFAPHSIYSLIEPPAPMKWSISNWLPKDEAFKLVQSQILAKQAVIKRTQHFKELNALRQSYGLKPFDSLGLDTFFSERYKHIALFPEWYASPAEDWPPQITQTAFPLFDASDVSGLNEVNNFIKNGDKPIIASFGTGVYQTRSIVREIVEVIKLLGLRLIIVGGEVPECENHNILHVPYVDFGSILGNAKLLIHHGGIGTTAQAMKAGIPQLIRPANFDQFDNADIVKSLNLGDFLMSKDFTKDRLAQKVGNLLSSKSVAISNKRVSQKVLSSNGISEACSLIGGWLGRA